eukprot:CAMPEP_0206624042 /NCGR_PEP_ID=MMETSP0325_2-20121206/63839_1 /ASSEMBLY_ACC=CAM_ASM_000347 /TAXON_ID=2866 /ORGANISM="Crypthecodinium cohnii, Strain Seligo" /LENGTH=507 /DNA_ID=CAMNT_0054147829 /DNA_START=250 /DNA_END=1770 /DNA_ORIENTATION=+
MQTDWQLSEEQIQKLHFEDQIGEGSYGKVHRASLPGSSSVYAVKVVEIDVDQDDAMKLKDTAVYKTINQEIAILRNCQCVPQIVRVFGVGVNFAADLKARVMVVMELCEHGSVSDILRRLGTGLRQEEIRVIVREVLLGLKYLHDDKKIHRDVKAGNILLTKQLEPKLADFGISCELQNTFAKRDTMIGSPYWMAPEVIKAGFGYNSRADIWSLGITCVEMAECQPPYFHIPPSRAMFVIFTKPPTGLTSTDLAKNFSKDFIAFLSSCLAFDPKERPSAQALLEHSFACRSENEPSASEALEATLGVRLQEVAERDQQGARPGTGSLGAQGSTSSRRDSWQRRSASVLPRPPSGSNLSTPPSTGALPLEAATPSIDAFAGATMVFNGGGNCGNSGTAKCNQSDGYSASAPSQYRRWRAGTDSSSKSEDGDEEQNMDEEEIRRRAREWVNKTVPMETVEDEIDSPKSVQKGCTASGCVWDSDEEGVVTRIRAEAQPEAGAGGPSSNLP